jgi:hypothetical protein
MEKSTIMRMQWYMQCFTQSCERSIRRSAVHIVPAVYMYLGDTVLRDESGYLNLWVTYKYVERTPLFFKGCSK